MAHHYKNCEILKELLLLIEISFCCISKLKILNIEKFMCSPTAPSILSPQKTAPFCLQATPLQKNIVS